MPKNAFLRLDAQRRKLESQLPPELVEIVEGDTGILTARMTDEQRRVAVRLREVSRRLAAA